MYYLSVVFFFDSNFLGGIKSIIFVLFVVIKKILIGYPDSHSFYSPFVYRSLFIL